MTAITHELPAIRYRVTNTAPAVKVGAIALAGFMALFGIWALTIPIGGATIAAGVVVSDGRTQTLRHDKGGVIASIKVAEGQHVARGDVVAVLRPENAEANLGQLTARLAGLDVQLARLAAQRDGQAFPPAQGAAAFPLYSATLIAPLIADQTQEWSTGASRLASERSVLEAQRQSLEEDSKGMEGARAAIDAQLASIGEDLALRRAAQQKGYGRAAVMRSLERDNARLEGELARLQGELAASEERKAEIAHKMEALDATNAQDVAAEIAKVSGERLELSNQLAAATADLDQLEIKADAPGTVDKLLVNTVGAAVEPYGIIAEIVPDNSPVLIEARVQPGEIDGIKMGQEADVVLSALSRKQEAPLLASVVFVSPDSHVDERTGARYFTVRLSLNQQDMSGHQPLGPGMTAETFFRQPGHTLAQYLVSPLTDSFARSFR